MSLTQIASPSTANKYNIHSATTSTPHNNCNNCISSSLPSQFQETSWTERQAAKVCRRLQMVWTTRFVCLLAGLFAKGINKLAIPNFNQQISFQIISCCKGQRTLSSDQSLASYLIAELIGSVWIAFLNFRRSWFSPQLGCQSNGSAAAFFEQRHFVWGNETRVVIVF